METKYFSRWQVLVMALSRMVIVFLALGGLLFLSAGTFGYWNAWLLLGTLFILMAIVLVWLLIRDPELLAKRLHLDEKRPTQKRFVIISLAWLAIAFILPGLDSRFGWSALPAWLPYLGVGLLTLGYAGFILVLRCNSYASRVIEIQEGQKLIDRGPYRLVRHPMYSSATLIYLAMPLVLGSLPGLAASALILVLLPIRILNEEKLLLAELPGYAEYCQRVRWRLIPGIW